MALPSVLQMALKAFGIEIPPDTLAQINDFIPKAPQIVAGVANQIQEFDARLQRLEEAQERTNAYLEKIVNATRSNGSDSIHTVTGPTDNGKPGRTHHGR
jgi:uncharacterized protein (DUF3084 family)